MLKNILCKCLYKSYLIFFVLFSNQIKRKCGCIPACIPSSYTVCIFLSEWNKRNYLYVKWNCLSTSNRKYFASLRIIFCKVKSNPHKSLELVTLELSNKQSGL